LARLRLRPTVSALLDPYPNIDSQSMPVRPVST